MTCQTEEVDEDMDGTMGFTIFVLTIAASCLLAGLWIGSGLWRRFPPMSSAEGVQTDFVEKVCREVCVQAPVTYKRHWATPRFHPLRAGEHGAFVEGLATNKERP